jgi:capsule assembly protein Wzi
MRALTLLLVVTTVGGFLIGPLAAQQGSATSTASAYVPIHHWAMPYVEHLIATGALTDPTPLTRPLRRADLVRALEDVDTLRVSEAAYATVQRLRRAFRSEAPEPRYRFDGDVGVAAATYNVRDPLELGRGVPPRPYRPSRLFGSLGAELQLEFGHGIAVSHIYEDMRLRTDPDWFDTRRNGLRAAEAYVGGQWRYAELVFGVLDRNWGPSSVQGLLLSDNPYNLDHLAIQVGPRSVQLHAVVTQLDTQTDTSGAPVNRYMMQHRLYVHPPGRWTVAAWEGTVWSGVGRQAEPWFLNIVNVGYLVGSYVGGSTHVSNGFLGLDVERRGATTLFGQFLLDDIQIQRREPADLKPTSYGLTAGAKGGLRQGAVAWTAFYTRVANLTYRNEEPLQVPLFHLLGTGRNFADYDQATVKLSLLTQPGALLEPEVTVLRQGEGDPRLPHPPVAAYPTTPTIFQGVVERTIRLALGGSWQRAWWGVAANAGVHVVHNAGHVTGASATHFVGSVGLTYRVHYEHGVP